MQQETEDLMAQASEFIEENEELLDDPEISIHVLEAILIQGAPTGTRLVEEYERLSHIVKSEAGKLEDAIRSKKLPPKQVAVLDVEYRRSVARAEAANNELTRFIAFMEKAQALYHREQGDERAVAEEMGVEVPENNTINIDCSKLSGGPPMESGKIQIVRDTPKTPWYNPLRYFFN